VASVLHLIGHNDPLRAVPVIAGQLAAGDAVTVVVLGPTAPALPSGPTVHRVPSELTWNQLLDLILAADQTFSW